MATDLFVEGKGCAGQAERRKKCSEIRKQFDSTREARNGKFKLNSQKKSEAANQKSKARYSDNSSKFRKFRQDNKGKSWKFCTVFAKSKKTRKVTQEKYDLSAFKAANVNAKKNSYQQVERLWRKVDSQGSGKINSKQLDNLCNKFGLLDKVPADKNGECTFESFATWWFSDKTTKKHEANADKKDKVAKAKSSRPTRKKESYQSKKEDQEKRSAKQAQTQKWRDAFKAFKGEQQKIKATPVGKKVFITVHTPSRKKLDIIHFDITKYQPAHAPWRSLRQVEKLWTKFDKAGTGSLDAKTFDSLVKELGLEDSCDHLAKQDTVRLADFTSWWFGPEKATHKPLDKFSKEYQQKRNSARKTRAARPCHNTANVPSRANQTHSHHEEKNWVKQRNQLKKHLREARKQRGSDHRGHNEITILAATPGFKYSNTYSYNKYRPLICDFGQQDFTYLSSTWNKVDKLGSGRIQSSKVNEVLDKLGVKDRPEGITRRNGTIHYEDFVRWFHNSPEQTEEKTDVDEKKRAKHDSIQKQCKTTAEKRKAKFAPKSPKKARRQQREEAHKKYKARTDELKKHIQSNSPTKAKTQEAPLEIQWAHRVEGKKKKDLFKYDQSTYEPLYLDLGLQRQKGQVERCFDKYDQAKTGRIKEADIKKLVEDLGLSKATDLNALYAKCKEGEIIVEDFLRWWFSEARDTSKNVPSAPPSPPRSKTKKRGAAPRSPARRGKDPVKLLSKNQRDVARYQARLKAAQKSKQLKKFVKESPKKLNRDFNIEIFAPKQLTSSS